MSLPFGSGQYPKILQGDGAEITRRYTNGLLVEMRDAEGRPTFITRDQGGTGYVGAMTDSEGNTTTYVRDYAGRVLEEVDALGRTNRFAYNTAGFLTSRVDRLGRAWAYTRGTNNVLTRLDYPDGSYETWTHNGFGQILTHRFRNGGVESFSYFGTNETDGLMGDLKVRTNALGQAVGYTWSTAGLMSSRTDERGNMMSLSYDWRGQMVAQTNADLTAIGVQYDPFGNRTNVIDELGHGTAYTYDGFNRVATMRDALGRTTTNEYGLTPGCGSCGGSGETVTRITRPDGKVTEFAYDHSGKRTNEVVAAGTTQAATTVWTYDAVGRLKTQVDAVGNLHTWVYDPVVAWSRRRTRSASRRSTHTTRSAT